RHIQVKGWIDEIPDHDPIVVEVLNEAGRYLYVTAQDFQLDWLTVFPGPWSGVTRVRRLFGLEAAYTKKAGSGRESVVVERPYFAAVLTALETLRLAFGRPDRGRELNVGDNE